MTRSLPADVAEELLDELIRIAEEQKAIGDLGVEVERLAVRIRELRR